ncbi:hypothetical protein DQ04_07081020 [Trypanosoma grayi]|uniref:hypothetical protein n=1 Tax=Trypanosoma grayi TaxID=71804 RepID=UPI0004F424B6|nr:hypothetical protein DQ04_07081020 [Trypanosoma grayi]KEG08483.1 hypothetical protein DQ04_07081020 [Trypanosoma grayi]
MVLPPWRYWLDRCSLVVLLLFLLYLGVLYHCAMEGHARNVEFLRRSESLNADAAAYTIPAGPMYSLRFHFPCPQHVDRSTENSAAMVRAVATADALILHCAEGEVWNQTELVESFSQTRRWALVEPLSPTPGSDVHNMIRLPERQWPLPSHFGVPVPVIIRLRDVSVFGGAQEAGAAAKPPPRVPLSRTPIAACFLVETDPTRIPISSGGTLQDELLADPAKSRIPSVAMHLSHVYNADWAFFVSPCRTNGALRLDQQHLDSALGHITVWWVCVATDTLVEVNAAARLLTVLSSE